MTANYYALEYIDHADIATPGRRAYKVVRFSRLSERENWVRNGSACRLMRGHRQRLLAGDPIIAQARIDGLLFEHGE